MNDIILNSDQIKSIKSILMDFYYDIEKIDKDLIKKLKGFNFNDNLIVNCHYADYDSSKKIITTLFLMSLIRPLNLNSIEYFDFSELPDYHYSSIKEESDTYKLKRLNKVEYLVLFEKYKFTFNKELNNLVTSTVSERIRINKSTIIILYGLQAGDILDQNILIKFKIINVKSNQNKTNSQYIV